MSAAKSISIQQLSGAVHKAVSNVKVPATAKAAGPLAYINPGLICGLIYYGPIAEFPEAKTIAASIATEISTHAGQTLAPVVQESAVGAQAAATPHLPPHIILGFQIKNLAVHF
jgi:hypothetical protein